MRQLRFIFIGLCLCGLLQEIGRGESFKLNDGQTLTGEVVSPNENGLIVRLEDGKYSDRVPWTKFSQEDLRRLAQDPKLVPLVEPFIEVSLEEKMKRTEVEIKPVARLDRPEPRSLFAALFSSSIGVVIVLLIYAANIYAAYEVAIVRAQPRPLVCGLAAIPLLGFLSPIIFLSMPTRIQRSDEELDSGVVEETPTFAVPDASLSADNPALPDPGAPAAPATPPAASGGLHIAHAAPAETTGTPVPAPQVFQRGAYMFNRRFFETKFPGFFGAIRRDADKEMALLIKTPRGDYLGERITRISANELHLEIHKGGATEEVMISFQEIKEIQLKHRNT